MGKYDALLMRLAPQSRSNLPAMLAARRRMVDNVMTSAGQAAELIARGPEAEDLVRLSAAYGDHWGNHPAERLNARVSEARGSWMNDGSFGPIADDSVLGVVSYRRGNRGTRRHEVLHGLTEAARQGVGGMPYWSRVAASNPLGLGDFLDELSAQRAGGRSAMLVPWPSYAIDYARQGAPASAAAAGIMAVPQVAAGAAIGLGAGLGAAALRDAMYPDDPDKPAVEDIAGQFDRQVDILRRRRPE